MGDFNDLRTVKFQQKMKPAALRIYQRIFPECRFEDLREKGFKVHVLDQEFGIDGLIHIEEQWISVQEKYRKNYAMKYMDFTQEYKNAAGTQHEANGEWFKLGAQLYFYGWANKEETDFEKWALIDIAKYKMLVDSHGGLGRIGQLKFNKEHGSASFYAIPISVLEPTFVIDYRKFLDNGAQQNVR